MFFPAAIAYASPERYCHWYMWGSTCTKEAVGGAWDPFRWFSGVNGVRTDLRSFWEEGLLFLVVLGVK